MPSIDSFRQIVQQAQQQQQLDHTIGAADQQLQLETPTAPPSAWTNLKAGLSKVPLLGRLGALQSARAEVNQYQQQLDNLSVSNRQVRAGFVKALHHDLGEGAADMATKRIDVNTKTPLTARAVKNVLSDIDQARDQARDISNRRITLFVDSPVQGGHRGPGETDIINLCLDKGFKLNDAADLSGIVGEDGAKAIKDAIRQGCKGLDNYSNGNGILTNQDIADVAGRVLDLYADMKHLPGMDQDALSTILQRASTKPTVKAIENTAREGALMHLLKPKLDLKNPASSLSQAANVQQNPTLEAAAKDIAKGMTEYVEGNWRAAPEHFGCGSDLQSIRYTLDKHLSQKITDAIERHQDAVQAINKSATLTDAQKALLTDIAQSRRMDPEQVKQYESMSSVMQSGLQTLLEHAQRQDTDGMITTLHHLDRAAAEALTKMRQSGADLWEITSLYGGDTRLDVFSEFVRVAGTHQDVSEPVVGHLTASSLKQSIDDALLSAMDQGNKEMLEKAGGANEMRPVLVQTLKSQRQ